MPDGPRWRLEAPAKLNLSLRVLGRRPDGLHTLESLLVLLDLADVLTVSPGGSELVVRGPQRGGVPDDRTNLAWRGWAAGWGEVPAPAGLAVDKHVPVAAGLGGGSSDAAAAWRLARHVSGQIDGPADRTTLVALSEIGADVPFFAAQLAAALVSGIGERVEPAGTDQAEVVLVHPPFALSTAAVFAELRTGEWSRPASDPSTPGRTNDLLAPARRLRPELDEVFRLVAGAGGDPRLSGSGPTVFVTTDDPERAVAIASRCQRAGLATTRTRLRTEPASIEAW
jgi:4-diphosphocytidyl-2-C-methyl-D-erythritol kinase